jgi:hypothetical protein
MFSAVNMRWTTEIALVGALAQVVSGASVSVKLDGQTFVNKVRSEPFLLQL